MSLFTMCEWEYNGRDDSDWYAVIYDDEKDSLYRIETGTTRFAEALHTKIVMAAVIRVIMAR
jgi:hypothetical protein